MLQVTCSFFLLYRNHFLCVKFCISSYFTSTNCRICISLPWDKLPCRCGCVGALVSSMRPEMLAWVNPTKIFFPKSRKGTEASPLVWGCSISPFHVQMKAVRSSYLGLLRFKVSFGSLTRWNGSIGFYHTFSFPHYFVRNLALGGIGSLIGLISLIFMGFLFYSTKCWVRSTECSCRIASWLLLYLNNSSSLRLKQLNSSVNIDAHFWWFAPAVVWCEMQSRSDPSVWHWNNTTVLKYISDCFVRSLSGTCRNTGMS